MPLERQKYIGASTPLSMREFIRTTREDTHDLSPRRPEVVAAVNQVKFRDDARRIVTASTFKHRNRCATESSRPRYHLLR